MYILKEVVRKLYLGNLFSYICILHQNLHTMKNANLFDTQSDRSAIITLSDKKVITESINKGKSRIAEKEFASEEEASKQYEKKRWELLKKGYVERNNTKEPGTPVLHCLAGLGYTGALSFEDTPDGIYIYKHGWFNTAKDQKDFLLLIDREGNQKETIDLPKILAWDIRYCKDDNSLLMDIDHYIYKYSLADKKFTAYTSTLNRSVSFISVSDNNIAYGSHPKLFIKNKSATLEKDFDVEVIKGSIPFCAGLSKNGKILAFHNKEGEIQLIDTHAYQLVKTIQGEFRMIDELQFVDNDKTLVVREQYGKWCLHYFDVEEGIELFYPELIVPEFSPVIFSFCFNADESLLVQLHRTKAYVFDYKNKKLIYSFTLEHCVKKAEAKFVGDMLGVRTDYGCFSLYRL